MRALVVHESMFGNTRDVARAVADGLAAALPGGSVESVEVGEAPPLDTVEVDLLVVGAPTHAFGLSRPTTRADAAEKAAQAGLTTVSTGQGVREWTGSATRVRCLTAAFDTHVTSPDLPGHACRRIDKRLRRLGGRPVTEPQTFGVGGMTGPLGAGEVERARQWGTELARLTIAQTARSR